MLILATYYGENAYMVYEIQGNRAFDIYKENEEIIIKNGI